MPWRSNGYALSQSISHCPTLSQSALKGEDCARSQSTHKKPMPWISNGYPWIRLPWRVSKTQDCPGFQLSQSTQMPTPWRSKWVCIVPVHFTLSHAVPICLEGWRLSRIPVYPGMPMPWIPIGLQIAPVHPEGSHIVAVCLEGWRLSRILVYPGMPMPWISNGYPWIVHREDLRCPRLPRRQDSTLSQSALMSKIQDCPTRIVLGLHAVPAYPGISSQFTLKTGRCPSLSRDANAMKIQWVCIVPVHFTLSHAVPVCLEGWRLSRIPV